MLKDVEILDDGRVVAVSLPDGTRCRFHAIWLRDNAWDHRTRAPDNGQRLLTLSDIPPDTLVTQAWIEG